MKSCRILFSCITSALVILLLKTPVNAASDEIRHVLLLHSYHAGMTWVENIEKAVDDVLTPPESNLVLHIEYLDSKRVHGKSYYQGFAHVLAEKYARVSPDLILSSDNNAFDFLKTYRDLLFPNTPIVFCGVNDFHPEMLEGFKNVTGVAEIPSAFDTVDAILRLKPDTRRIYVINDYLPTGRAWTRDIEKQLAPLAERVQITYNANLPIKALQRKITSFEPGTVILLGVYFTDKNGEYFTYEKLGAQLTSISRVPVFCLLRFNLRDGVIGGKLINGYSQGAMMSRMARRVLDGTPADQMPVQQEGANRFIFDSMELTRFNIAEDILPETNTVINRPFSFYETYKALVWMTISVICSLLALVFLLTKNIFSRRRMEQELRVSEAKYRSIFDNANEGIFQTTPDGRILTANQAFADILGYSSAAACIDAVTNLAQQIYANSTDREEVLRRLAEDDQISNYEVEFIRRKGESIWVTLNAHAIRNAQGTLTGIEGMLQDITERRKREEAEKQREIAQKADQTKSKFIANMSHELRTPLNAILGYAQILTKNRELPPKTKEGLSVIRQSGNHLLTLINDILDFSKIEARKIDLLPETLELRPFLDGIASMMRIKARQKNISFEYQASDDIPDFVQADEKRLRQILINLLSNAIKFTDNGGVVFRIFRIDNTEKTETDRHGRSVANMASLRFEVIDSGVGIAEAHLQQIFEPFHQIQTTAAYREGTGLGLTISQQLVSLMGGTIEVESKPGAGSRFGFNVLFPVVFESDIFSAEVYDQIKGYTGDRRRVLIVDDNPANRQVLETLLIPLGFLVSKADNGETAVKMVETENPHIVLMDLVMPKKDGFQATREIRENPANEDLPIIAVSASAYPVDLKESLMAGCDAFLPKPVDYNTLLTLLHRLLGLEWIYEAQSATPQTEKRRLNKDIIFPDPEALSTLHELAILGKNQQIRKWAETLMQTDDRYAPFANRIIEMAAEFDDMQIAAFIKPYMDGGG